MKRLFIALWPNQETRKQIDLIKRSIAPAGLKMVKCDDLHITLIFLGNISAESEAMIRQGMQNISAQPFTLYFDQLAFWRKPRVLCLLTEQYDQQLLRLYKALQRELQQCNIAIDDRLYKPHITLARKANKLIDMDVPLVKWRAKSFCLVESISTPEGVHYQVLQRWDFK